MGERNNERNVSNKRGKAANFKVQEPGRDNNRNRNISGGVEDGVSKIILYNSISNIYMSDIE